MKTLGVTDSLVSIGAFASAVGVPASALRYYDEVGVLPPAHVDPVTGYRFYDPAQMRRARLVGALRGVGLSVEEMRSLLDAKDDSVAGRLLQLADSRTAKAGRSADLLRSMAAGLRESVSEAFVLVDATYLAVALDRVARVTGEGQFDAVQVVIDDALLVMGTDRYRLARWRIRAAAAPTGGAAGLVSGTELARLTAWLRTEDLVTCRIADGAVSFMGVQSDQSCRGHEEGFPDLTSLYIGRAPVGRHRGLRPCADLIADREVLELELDGCLVRFSQALLAGAVTSLLGEEVLLLMDEPEAAVLLRSPGQPDHDVLLMPRTEE